jgi:hypothetical protein
MYHFQDYLGVHPEKFIAYLVQQVAYALILSENSRPEFLHFISIQSSATQAKLIQACEGIYNIALKSEALVTASNFSL